MKDANGKLMILCLPTTPAVRGDSPARGCAEGPLQGDRGAPGARRGHEADGPVRAPRGRPRVGAGGPLPEPPCGRRGPGCSGCRGGGRPGGDRPRQQAADGAAAAGAAAGRRRCCPRRHAGAGAAGQGLHPAPPRVPQGPHRRRGASPLPRSRPSRPHLGAHPSTPPPWYPARASPQPSRQPRPPRPAQASVSPLYCAAQSGFVSTVELILSRGADANCADSDGAPPRKQSIRVPCFSRLALPCEDTRADPADGGSPEREHAQGGARPRWPGPWTSAGCSSDTRP